MNCNSPSPVLLMPPVELTIPCNTSAALSGLSVTPFTPIGATSTVCTEANFSRPATVVMPATFGDVAMIPSEANVNVPLAPAVVPLAVVVLGKKVDTVTSLIVCPPQLFITRPRIVLSPNRFNVVAPLIVTRLVETYGRPRRAYEDGATTGWLGGAAPQWSGDDQPTRAMGTPTTEPERPHADWVESGGDPWPGR